jgi:hypothetical protein
MFSMGTAFADLMFTVDTGNGPPGLGQGTGPYATALVHLVDATNATVTFTFDSLDDGTYTYLMGDGGTIGVSVDASSWTFGVSGTNSFAGFTPGPFSNGGAANEDGFGSFNQTINSFDGYTHSSTEVVLNLANTGGTWADASSVLTANAKGFSVAIHGFACTDPCDVANEAAFTGFGANGDGGTTPSGGSVRAASFYWVQPYCSSAPNCARD